MADYYQVLSISHVATSDEIQAAYQKARAAALITEPEGDPSLNEGLKEIEAAYTTLIDPGLRAAYDRSLGSQPGTALMVPGQINVAVRTPNEIPVVQQPCPYCGALNPVQMVVCQQCGQQMTRSCPNCGQSVLLTYTICPRCNIALGEYDRFRFAQAANTSNRIDQDRREGDQRHQAVERVNNMWLFGGIAFWVLVILIVIGLIALGIAVFFIVLSLEGRQILNQGISWDLISL